MSVSIGKLGRFNDSAKLGEGGTAIVYRTNFRVSSYSGPLAYKELLTTLSTDERDQAVHDLVSAVAFRAGLPATEQAELDARSAWPLETVTNGGRVVGGLMPLIRPEFFADVTPPPTGTPKSVPRSFDRLSGDPATAVKAGYSVAQLNEFASPTLRLVLVAQLAYTVAWLHKRGLVVGDISLKNVVFAVDPPRVVLLDCDGTAAQTDPRRAQLNTFSFLAPECWQAGSSPYARGNPNFQDTRTDVFKLGLCLVRGLAQGRGVVQAATSKHLEGVYAPEVVTLASRALSANPDDRPTAAEFYEILRNYIAATAPPPVIHFFRAIDTVVPRGADVVFEWDVENATTLVLHGPGGAAVTLDPRAGRYAVRADVSGTYTLQALRRGGSTTLESGLIRTFDLPRFDPFGSAVFQQVVPQIPALPSADFDSIRTLPARPSVEIGNDFVPAIALPTVEALVGSAPHTDAGLWMSSIAGPPVALPWHISGLGHEFAAAGGAVRDLVSQVHEHLRTELDAAASRHLTAAMTTIGNRIAANAAASRP